MAPEAAEPAPPAAVQERRVPAGEPGGADAEPDGGAPQRNRKHPLRPSWRAVILGTDDMPVGGNTHQLQEVCVAIVLTTDATPDATPTDTITTTPSDTTDTTATLTPPRLWMHCRVTTADNVHVTWQVWTVQTHERAFADAIIEATGGRIKVPGGEMLTLLVYTTLTLMRAHNRRRRASAAMSP